MKVAVVGAGPAGLIAAETLAAAGAGVTVFDRMPSVARKFLIAGRGGLNLTHSEGLETFLTRYRPAAPLLLDAVRASPPAALITWCEGLGVESFVGSSGRVFPKPLKASPLLRAWLGRLAGLGVEIRTRHGLVGMGDPVMSNEAAPHPSPPPQGGREPVAPLAPSPLAGEGWGEGASRGGGHARPTLTFSTPAGTATHAFDAVLLALGGASWPRLGGDGGWVTLFPDVAMTPFAPSNVGFVVGWSPHVLAHAGTPLKRIAVSFAGETARGEAMLTATGIEGGAIYALSAPIREAIARDGAATFHLDLRPDLPAAELRARLAARPRAETLSTRLRKELSLTPAAIALVQEALHAGAPRGEPAALVKALPLTTHATAGLARAISSAGGIGWGEIDAHFMLRRRPGVFVCGEMLDWEAPTGGYLLQACFATGVAAAKGVLAELTPAPPPAA